MSSLQEAREAIQSGNLPTAQAIIAEVLKSDQNNAEAWFLLSEATAGDRKLIFLNKTLALDPTFQEAIDRKAELEGAAEPDAAVEPEPELIAADEPGDDFDEIPSADFDSFGNLEDEDEEDEIFAPAETFTAEPEPIITPRPPLAEVSKAKEPKPTPVANTNTVNEEDEDAPSNLLNNVGFAFSLALSAVLLILFIQQVLALF